MQAVSYKDHATNEEVHAKIQQVIGPHEDLTILRDTNCNGMVMSPVYQVWLKPSCKAQWKGEEDKADRRKGGKTASGNGQTWSSPSPRERGKWRKLVVKLSVVPKRPLQLLDRWNERWVFCCFCFSNIVVWCSALNHSVILLDLIINWYNLVTAFQN